MAASYPDTASNPFETGSSRLLLSLAVSAGLCIIMGGLGFSLKPRDQCGRPDVDASIAVWLLFGMCLLALIMASVQAAEYPVLRAYIPGYYAAGILAGSTAVAYWATLPDRDHQIMVARWLSLTMIAVYFGILFETRTRLFTDWARMLDATLKEGKN